MSTTRTGLRPGPAPRTVRDDDGVHPVPDGWVLLPPGDAAVTRAVKAAGPTWSVEEKRGRKAFSRGLWAPEANIDCAKADVAATRADPANQRKLEAGRERRAREQAAYVLEFEAEVLEFLAFHPRHAAMAADLARRVAANATPVGSGTVARTERIPVEERARAAVIAWMRHQTTTYDNRVVAPIKGARRELRRELAKESVRVLERYRRGDAVAPDCPLAAALLQQEPELVPAAPARPPLPPAPPPAAARSRAPAPVHASYGLATAPPVAPPVRKAPSPPRDPAAALGEATTPEEMERRRKYLEVRERLTRGRRG